MHFLSLGLPVPTLLCFLLFSVVIPAQSCTLKSSYLLISLPGNPHAGFPWDAPWQGRRGTCSVHPAWSCSQLGREAGAGALKLKEVRSLPLLQPNPQVIIAPLRSLQLENLV